MSLQQDKYPQIYPAREIVESLEYPHAPIKPKMPAPVAADKPSKYPNLDNNLKYTGISILILSVFIGIAHVIYNPLVFVVLITSFLCAVMFSYKSWCSYGHSKTYAERLSAYEKATTDYKSALDLYHSHLQKYEEDKKAYDTLVDTLKTPEDILNYRLAKRKQFLQSIKPKERYKDFFCIDGPKNPKLGRGEYFFKDYVSEAILNGQISNDFEFYFDASIMLIGYSSHKVSYFYPDLVVITPRGLMIDVEIDEPHVAESKKPIHCVHSLGRGDFNRNQYFIKNNCSVIRFSERQIIKYPEICLDIIRLYDDNGCIPIDLYMPEDFIESSWNEKEAMKMASMDYRNTY